MVRRILNHGKKDKDGSLTMVNIPGHSEGLCALKIRNAEGRYVLLFADGGYATKSYRWLLTIRKCNRR